MITTVKSWGNSHAIRIPKIILEALDISGDDELNISVENDKMIIEKVNKPTHMTLRERVAEYDADCDAESNVAEVNWGESKGKEIW